MGPHRRKKKNKNGGGPAPGGSGRDCYRRRRWGAGDDSSTTTGGSGKLRGEKYGPSVESTTEVSINDKDVSVVVDDSTAEANFTPAKRQPADENLADDENIEALEFSIEKRQPTDEPTATLESSRAVSAPAVTIQQPGDTTQTSSEEDNENSGDGSQESPSGELDEQGNPGVMAAPASPVVPKLSLHAEALKESFRSKRYDLGWTGEKRGTGLMRLVDIEIQKWLCAQEAKGLSVSEEIVAISNCLGSSSVSLGPLARQLCLPDSVSCALGLRLRGGEWNILLRKIEAARDFLDLKAEAVCSEALAAFGDADSAPESSHHIPLDVFAFLADREAAALVLVELELRQAIRAEANRVAPPSCVASAAFLFSRLDPLGLGVVDLNTFGEFCARLLGIADTGLCAEAHRNPRQHRGDTPHRKRESCRASMRLYVPVFTDPQPAQQPLLHNVERRLRRIFAVINRSVSVASSWRGRNNGGGNRHRSYHGSRPLSEKSSSSLVYSSRLEQTHDDHDSDSLSTDSSSSGGSKHPYDEKGISLETFCRFVEGKRFGAASNLEGFLRALAGAGRPLRVRQEDATHLRQAGSAADRPAVHTSVTASPRTVVGAPTAPRPDTPGARTVSGSAHWGGRGVRRASAQFARTIPPTETKIQYIGGRRTPPAEGRLSWPSRDGPGGRPIEYGPTPRGSTSRSGSATARLTGNTNSSRSSAAGTAYSVTSTKTTRAGLPGGLGVIFAELLAWDPAGSGAVSATELVSAMGQGVGVPLRRSWAEALVERFEATGVAMKDGVRWSGGTRGKLDLGAFVEFLRLKTFSLSVMTPFGLVELSVQDPLLTLGGLREMLVNKMFWRQHNCNVRRSDRNNFSISRLYGSLPLDTESPEQCRKLVADVLRPGELLFVTDRPPRTKRGDPQVIPRFSYMMGEGCAERTRLKQHAPVGSRRESTSDIGSANAGRSILVPNRRRRTVDIAGGKVITAEKKISDMSQSLLDHTSSTRRRVSDTAIDFPLRTTRCATEVAHVSNSEARTAKGVRGAPETVKQPPPHPIVAGCIFEWSSKQVERWISEAMELDRYRETFRRKQVDGAALTGLTEARLRDELGIANNFHVRKLLLHLDHLVQGALGPSRQRRIPRRISSWQTLDVLMWCWQEVGTRDRQTLALLRKAAIDGKVLTAMTTADWDELSTISPIGCRSQLMGISAAAQSLLNYATSGTIPFRVEHCRNKPETARASTSAASDVGVSVPAVAGSAAANHNNPPRAVVEVGGTEDGIPPQKEREEASPKRDVTQTGLGRASAAVVSSTPDITHTTAGVTAPCTPTSRNSSTVDHSSKLGRGSSAKKVDPDVVAKAKRESDKIRREGSCPACQTAPTDLDFGEHNISVNSHSGSAHPFGDFSSNGTANAAKLTPASPFAKANGRTTESRWNGLAESESWSELESEVGSSVSGSDTDDGRHVLLQ